jgi:hypothetical protein
MKTTPKQPPSLAVKNKLISAINEDQLAKQRIDTALAAVAKLLQVEEGDLRAWFYTFVEVPTIQLLSMLRLMTRYQLDPLCDEVSLVRLPTGQWYPFITIDGWTKLINQHAAFAGICFSESPQLMDGIPVWMECTIYRTDRLHPITVREYFSEVVTEYAPWKTMPRRMLRHRTLQQSARLAFGISGGSAVEVSTTPHHANNQISLQSAREHPTFLKAQESSNFTAQKVLAPKRIEQLREILGQTG